MTKIIFYPEKEMLKKLMQRQRDNQLLSKELSEHIDYLKELEKENMKMRVNLLKDLSEVANYSEEEARELLECTKHFFKEDFDDKDFWEWIL